MENFSSCTAYSLYAAWVNNFRSFENDIFKVVETKFPWKQKCYVVSITLYNIFLEPTASISKNLKTLFQSQGGNIKVSEKTLENKA